MNQTIYHLHTISGLHVGIGQGTGVIDLPIARERASNLPQVPGSGIKGVLRDTLRGSLLADDETAYFALFGPEAGEDASEYAGALAVGDARLLALPIRSWYGTFAWTTCPMILRRYRRDLEDCDTNNIPAIPTVEDGKARHTNTTELKDSQAKIYLEDLDLSAQPDADEWADFIARQIFTDSGWVELFKQRFLILPDNIFDFLSETATEIRSRIRIDENSRTVKQGALWYEEYLPAETLMWGILAADRSRKPGHNKTAADMLSLVPSSERLQIGGNATTGGGQVRWIKAGGE